ncbi:MAG: glycosyltransferase family 4 protein [Phycisphaeraceae bacterium]|nr:glycosyltransferase family 4 protein [Phycisphaeraceae bacterium]
MKQSVGSLRILHLTAGSDLGGVSRYLLDISKAMLKRGHHVTIAGERGAWHDAFMDAGITWIQTPLTGDLLTLRRAGRTLGRLLENESFDLVHAHYRRSARVGRQIASKWKIPLLLTLHLTDIPMHFPWRWLSDFGDHTHAPSLMARDWLINTARVLPQNITIIPHGIDTNHYTPVTQTLRDQARGQLNLPKDKTIASYVGRFDVPKNHFWLVDLALACKDRLPNVMILLAGDGPDAKRLEQLIQKHQLCDQMRLLDYRDPLMLYHASDAFLLPSAAEGFSLSCGEALSCGIPVLRTQTAGYQEQIVENQTGLSIPVDHDLFMTKAMSFLSDRVQLAMMGTQAAMHVREHLSFDQQVTGTLELYQRLAGRS